MRTGQTLDASIIGFFAEAVQSGTRAAGGTRAAKARTVTRHRARLTGVGTAAAYLTLSRRQTRSPGHEPATAGLAHHVGWVIACVRGCSTGFLPIAILTIVTIAIILALDAQPRKCLATESAT